MQEFQIDYELPHPELTRAFEASVLHRLRSLTPPPGAKLRLQVTVSVLPAVGEPAPPSDATAEAASPEAPASAPDAGPGAAPVAGWHLFTLREREVMELVVAGLTTKQAAQRLAISHRTVEIHRSRAMQKVGAKNLAMFVLATMKSRPDADGR